MDENTTSPGECGAPLPENYPAKYSGCAEIKCGSVLLRPIRPDDDELMLELFKTFSLDTIYHRFFSYVTMNPIRVKKFTHIDYKRHMAIVAEMEVDGRRLLTGVARYNMPPEAVDEAVDEAEMAIVVGDPWQSRGIGTSLLAALLAAGRDEGFRILYGLVQFDNHAVPRLFEKLHQEFRTVDNGTEWRYEVEMCAVNGCWGQA